MYKHLDLFKDLVSAFSTMSQVKYRQCCTVIAGVPLADPQLNDLLLFCPNRVMLRPHACQACEITETKPGIK